MTMQVALIQVILFIASLGVSYEFDLVFLIDLELDDLQRDS